MDQEDHIKRLGMLLNYFHTLEFILRSMLRGNEDGKPARDYSLLKPGDKLAENFLTNNDSLEELIDKYNTLVPEKLRISKEIVEIRDAIVHGRIFMKGPESPARLLRFSKPKDRMVSVRFAVTLDERWFKEKTYQIYWEVEKALKAVETSGLA